MRKLVIILCAAGLLLALCLPARAVTSITFWHALRGSRGEVVQELVNQFNAQHPDVAVQVRFIGSTDRRFGNDYHALDRALMQQLAGGNPPDVVQVYENWTTQLIEVAGLVKQPIVPVEQFFNGPNGLSPADLADLVPVFRQANTVQGRMWTLPFNKSIFVLYYNKALLPQPPHTMADLKAAILRVAQAHPGVSGLVFEPSVDTFANLLYANGGQFFDVDGKPAFADNAGVQALHDLVALTGEKAARASLHAEQQFVSGRAAMFLWSTSSEEELARQVRFPLGVAPMPGHCELAGTNLAILAPSARQAAAWSFVKF
ncbi:MAG: extracellular solute-binding protein [Candidatus Xenobia bacterium]